MSLSRVSSLGRALCAVAVVSFASACGDTSTPPPTPVATTITLSSGAFTLDGLGATQQLTATVKDQNGAAMSGQTVSWGSDASGVATVGTDGLVTAVATGTAHVTATSGSLTASVVVTVTQNPAALAKSAGDAQTGVAGSALANPIVVMVSDAKSNPISGVAVTFAVTGGGGSVGTPSATTAADGTASTTWTLGTTAGVTQTATATVAGISAPAGFTATATAGPAAIIATVSGNNQTGTVSAALANPIVVKVTDANANPVAGTTVNFAVTAGGGSVLPTSQATGANGQAQAAWTLGPATGANTITASATGLTGSPQTFTATGTTLSFTSITEDTLVEGSSIHLNGTGFSTTAANNTVSIDGTAATVTAATATQLTVTVPTYDCKPARDGSTTITVSSVTTPAIVKRIHPASFITATAVGAQQIIQTPANFCLQFRPNTVGGDAYIVGVGAAAESPSSQFGITISTGTGASSAPIFAAPAALPLFGRGSTAAARTQTSVEAEVQQRWARQFAAEARLRNWEQRNLFGASARAAAAAPRPSGAPAALPSVGDTIRFQVIDFSQGNLCTGGTSVLGKVKAVGTAGIWLTDVANPGPDTLTNAEIQAYSDTFDTKIYAGDTTNFGPPSDIDGNQHVFILMTIAVNKEAGGGIAGFVFSGDLFSKAACGTSNVGEVFYGNVPDPGNVATTGARSHASISNQLPSLIAHEFTHDIQNGRRLLQAGGTNMAAWEAEGQAMMAQEVVGHQVLGNSAGQNYTFAQEQVGQGPRWYQQGFDLLGSYFGFKYTSAGKNANSPEQCSMYANTATANIACFNFAFYGASWSFQRYIVDRFGAAYPGGATKLTRDVIGKSVNLSGRPNWEALLGISSAAFDSLYAQWGAMLYVDDRVGGATAAQQMSSWNLFDLFTNYGANYQLTPTSRTFTAFSDARTVNGGGTAYTVLSSAGAHPALAVKVRDGVGGVISATPRMQLWITRIQ